MTFCSPSTSMAWFRSDAIDMALVAHARFDQEREIGRAGADIERPAFVTDGDIGGGNMFPSVMESETQ